MSWSLINRLRKILAAEQGAAVFPAGSRRRFALVYPNSYYVGMSNLGLHIMYQQINSRGDTACERAFLPDKDSEREYLRTNTPLLTIETQTPLNQFLGVGFAVNFELDYFNLLKILEMGRISLVAAERDDSEPLIIGGGPCVTFNPEPLADILDICLIGEGEKTIQRLLDTVYNGQQKGWARASILRELADIPGLYVPRFYRPVYKSDGTIANIDTLDGVPAKISRQWIKDLARYPGQTVVATRDTGFGDMYLIEVARGCGRHCRFCMAGYCFRRPRVRDFSAVAKAVDEARQLRNKVGLVGAAVSDYPDIDRLCEKIMAAGLELSVASLRADSLSETLVKALARSGHQTITLAPEAASSRLRQVINKGINDRHINNAVRLAVSHGIPNVRLYIMVGLPSETAADITAIIEMARTVKRLMVSLGSKGKLTLSINPFVPKPFTPFQWLPMADIKQTEANLNKIRQELRKDNGIEILIESPREAVIQGVLARGDRQLGKVLLAAHQAGGQKAFKKALKQYNLAADFYLYRERGLAEVLPWQTLDMGLNPDYLATEFNRARQGTNTEPCRPGCTRCGIC